MTSISVIVPVGRRYERDIGPLYAEYKAGMEMLGLPYEFIFSLDGPHPQVAADLEKLAYHEENIKVIQLTRRFGEAAALMAGFERSTGQLILTLPAYHQINSADIGRLHGALKEADLAIGYRSPRTGSSLEKLRRWAFHALLGWVTRLRFHDLGCSARLMRRQVLEEINPYGDQERFLAVLADRLGFKVREVAVRQSAQDRFQGRYHAREYAHQILDIFNVFFLVRFTKRPLRFFGSLGAITFGLGILLILLLVAERLFFGEPLADRPALLLSSLLAMLGMQLFALGLLGELIIFTHAREIKDYRIDRIVQREEPRNEDDRTRAENAVRILPRTVSHTPPVGEAPRIPTTTA